MDPRIYARHYIANALNCPAIDEPDHAQSGDLYEVLMSLHQSHILGGTEATKIGWSKLVEIDSSLAELTNPVPKRRLVSVAELKYLPKVEFIIEGMLPKHGLCEIHGAPGSGKSLFVLHLALTVSKALPVVYLAAEGASGYSGRVEAWELANEKSTDSRLYFHLESVNLLDGIEVDNFISIVEPIKPVLIVIDTFARCISGGDENSARDVGLAIAACDKIRNAVGATILIVHHTGKIGSSERGSSALRGGCDSMIELTNTDDVITVTSSKLKDGKAFEPQTFTMQEFGESVALVPCSSKSRHSTPTNLLKDTDRRVLDMLKAEIYVEHGATYKRIADNTGITGGTLDRVLSRLKKYGYMSQSKKGDPYFISAKGLEALDA